MEILQQVCSRQLPLCALREEDLLQNPHFSKLLLSLSQHVDESGLSLSLAKEQAQAWKEVRLHKTTWLRSEILQRVIQELLVDYYVKTQDTDVTSEDKKFHQTLEQRLLVTELTQLLGPSQEREMPPLLGLEKADLLELMPPSEDFVWMRARLPLEVEKQLKKKCFTLLCYHDPSSGGVVGAVLLFPARCFSRWLSAGGKALAYPCPSCSLDQTKKCQRLASSPLPATCGARLPSPRAPPGGRGRPGTSPDVPDAAAKSWTLSAAGFSGAKGEALATGRVTERVPARGAFP